MSTGNASKKSSFQINAAFSPRKIMKLLKLAKPVFRLMTKKNRTNVVTPSTCNYDIEEILQNDMNECELFQLKFKFLEGTEGSEADENAKNEELEKRLLYGLREEEEEDRRKAGLQECVAFQAATPPFALRRMVCAASTDWDVCRRGGGYLTCGQLAEQQVAV